MFLLNTTAYCYYTKITSTVLLATDTAVTFNDPYLVIKRTLRSLYLPIKTYVIKNYSIH